jgi:hypothetical protein
MMIEKEGKVGQPRAASPCGPSLFPNKPKADADRMWSYKESETGVLVFAALPLF